MKTTIVVAMMMVAAPTFAQQTNMLDTLRQSAEQQQQSVLAQYGKDLDAAMAVLMKKGDLDNFLLVQTERKRLDAKKTVPIPEEAGDMSRRASDAYYRAMVSSMKQYIIALDGLMKTEVAADRIEEATAARAERDRASSLLADMRAKLQVQVFLTDLPEESARVGWGGLLKGKFLDDHGTPLTADYKPLTVNGLAIGHGLFAHASSAVAYDITGKGFQSLKGSAGLQDNLAGKVRFSIYGDGKQLWQSAIVKGAKPSLNTPGSFDVPVTGVKKLVLAVDDLGDPSYDHSIWIDPVLIR